jgi:Spy/CpxP family protein refolding chaperone
MTIITNQRTLVWIIIILIAINLSTVGSFYYHTIIEINTAAKIPEEANGIPADQRTPFFGEQLNLEANQIDRFREINNNYYQTARQIEMNLNLLRRELIDELGVQNPDSIRISQLNSEIGENHRKLKQLTATFYLNMKKICSKEQQAKLHNVFESMLNKEGQEALQRGRHQWGKRRNNQSHKD